MSNDISQLREQFFKSVKTIRAIDMHGRLAEDIDIILNYVARIEREFIEFKEHSQSYIKTLENRLLQAQDVVDKYYRQGDY